MTPDHSARHRADTWRGGLLCLGLVLSAQAYSFRLMSFLHAKELVLSVTLLAVAWCFWTARRRSEDGLRAFAPLWLALAVSGATGLVLFPAHVPAFVVEEGLRCAVLLLLVTFSFDLLGDAVWRERIDSAFLLSATFVAVLGLLQYARLIEFLLPQVEGYAQRVYSVFGNQDLFGGYLAMAVPVLLLRRTLLGKAALSRGRSLAADAALFLTVAGLVLSLSRSAWLAAAAGCTVALLISRGSGKAVLRPALVAGLAAAFALTASRGLPARRVAGTFSQEDVGGHARIWFWDGTLRMFRDAPWVGAGLGNYSYWSPKYLGEALASPYGRRHYHNDLHTLHAHAEPLEYAAETGLAGLAFGLWMLLRLLRRRGPAWGGLAALLVFSCFNASFHSAPHMLMGLIWAGMLLQPASTPASRRPVRLPGAPLAAAAVAMAAFWCTLVPSYHNATAGSAFDAGEAVLDRLDANLCHPWPNARGHMLYGIALIDAARPKEALHHFRKARQGLDTAELHGLIGRAAEESGQNQTACAAYGEALARVPTFQAALDGVLAVCPEADRETWLDHESRWGFDLPATRENAAPGDL